VKISHAALFLASAMFVTPAVAQITIIPMPPAPQPIAVGPPLATGIPQTPLTSVDAQFVQGQLDGNMAEIKLAQLALNKSQDQNIRNFAQKMIVDHTAANATLMPIASSYGLRPADTLSPVDQGMYDRLAALNGVAFDTIFIDGMITGHKATIAQLDSQITHGQNQQINVWVQNTRPVVAQHEMVAEQIKAVLPRTG
jgi:putative membrane protein